MKLFCSFFIISILLMMNEQCYSQKDSLGNDIIKHVDSSLIRYELKHYPVAGFGFYISPGFGLSSIGVMRAVSSELNLSFAYKSFLFTGELESSGLGEKAINYSNYYNNGCDGLLFGYSIRKKHILIAASSGFAYYYVTYRVIINSYGDDVNKGSSGINCPLDLKVFLLASDEFDIGLHYTLDIAGTYSPNIFSICIVLGGWNKI